MSSVTPNAGKVPGTNPLEPNQFDNPFADASTAINTAVDKAQPPAHLGNLKIEDNPFAPPDTYGQPGITIHHDDSETESGETPIGHTPDPNTINPFADPESPSFTTSNELSKKAKGTTLGEVVNIIANAAARGLSAAIGGALYFGLTGISYAGTAAAIGASILVGTPIAVIGGLIGAVAGVLSGDGHSKKLTAGISFGINCGLQMGELVGVLISIPKFLLYHLFAEIAATRLAFGLTGKTEKEHKEISNNTGNTKLTAKEFFLEDLRKSCLTFVTYENLSEA